MSTTESSAVSRPGLGMVLCLALTISLLHLVSSGGYGYFIDELYFLACSEHLDWGYIDMPPLMPAAAALSRWLLGDSLRAIRIFPTVAAGLNVLLAGLIVRSMGGRLFAQALACVSVMIAPGYLGIDNYLSMNAFEPLFWMGCAYVAILIFRGGDRRLWLLFGMLAGLGLENKYSMLFFGFAFVLSLLATRLRETFLDRWFWLGGLVALLVTLPHLVWEVRHGSPMLELLRHQREAGKYVPVTPASFAKGQIMFMHPLNFPLWLGGLAWLLFSRDGRPYRTLGVTFLLLWVGFTSLQGKDYYLAPAYPMLLAAGAVAIEGRLAGKVWERWIAAAILVVLGAGGILLAPLVIPALSPERYIAYSRALGISHSLGEKRGQAKLPQFLADQFGWPEMVETVARVHDRLPPSEQADCVVLATNYGDAGAIDFFGRQYGLPRAICGHNNYYLWGPGDRTGRILIAIDGRRADLAELYDRIDAVARTPDNPYVMPDRADRPIYLCRGPRASLKEVWPKFKIFW
jgi:Dolichyl-phosphate-mannose-protein mannosyltransferase